MLFDKSLMYPNHPDSDEREQIANIVIDSDIIKKWKTVGYFINIGVPLATCLLTQCNLLIVALVFVLTDIAVNLFDYYHVVIKPHAAIMNQTVERTKNDLQQRINERQELVDKINKRYDQICKDGNVHEIIEDDLSYRDSLNTYIKFESEWIEQSMIPWKEEELKCMQKPVKDYSDKKTFFEAFENKLHGYIKTYGLNCLQPVCDSIRNLLSTLELRPDGYESLPQMLYVYIEELQYILTKIAKLKKQQINDHLDDLEKVSGALSENIDRIVYKINHTDTETINVGLKVLIQELEKGDGL